jgi:hypothetical protein
MRGLNERQGWWYVRVPLGNGKYDRHSLNTRDEDEAKRQAASILAAHRAGVEGNILGNTSSKYMRKSTSPTCASARGKPTAGPLSP